MVMIEFNHLMWVYQYFVARHLFSQIDFLLSTSGEFWQFLFHPESLFLCGIRIILIDLAQLTERGNCSSYGGSNLIASSISSFSTPTFTSTSRWVQPLRSPLIIHIHYVLKPFTHILPRRTVRWLYHFVARQAHISAKINEHSCH